MVMSLIGVFQVVENKSAYDQIGVGGVVLRHEGRHIFRQGGRVGARLQLHERGAGHGRPVVRIQQAQRRQLSVSGKQRKTQARVARCARELKKNVKMVVGCRAAAPCRIPANRRLCFINFDSNYQA